MSYTSNQVLKTPSSGSPRRQSGFFTPHRFAPMGDAPVRKAGGPSTCGFSTSPATALKSSAPVSSRSDPYA